MPWSKSGNQQLDLLDAPAAPEVAPALPAPRSASARSASMVPTASLFEDPYNPRTEIPDAELDELADDVRQHGILQPIIVHPADAEGRHQIYFGAKRTPRSELEPYRASIRSLAGDVRWHLASAAALVAALRATRGR